MAEWIHKVICPATSDPNEVAISHCESGEKSLILTVKTGFCPKIQTMCERRGSVFFTEDKDCFGVVTESFDEFDAFVFVIRELNDFEREFFRQLGQRYNKRIIEIVSAPRG